MTRRSGRASLKTFGPAERLTGSTSSRPWGPALKSAAGSKITAATAVRVAGARAALHQPGMARQNTRSKPQVFSLLINQIQIFTHCL
jgi:hypothetical protein